MRKTESNREIKLSNQIRNEFHVINNPMDRGRNKTNNIKKLKLEDTLTSSKLH